MTMTRASCHMPWAAFVSMALCTALGRFSLAADSVQFSNPPPQVGERGAREMQFSLDLSVTLRQAGQLISDRRQQLTRKQERVVTVVEVTDKLVTKAQVFFSTAREEAVEVDHAPNRITQPIEGKTYVVERRASDLVVTDTKGNDVPPEERILVATAMESIGRPSPLGTLLHGKTVAVGQTLALPNEMASELFGVKEPGGAAQHVELTLRSVRHELQRQVADFNMLIVLKLPGGGTIDVKGSVEIDPDTCQVASASFSGPVTMREEHGPEGHTFEMISDGTMQVAVRSGFVK